MSDKFDVSGELPRPVAAPADGAGAHQFGLATATALIVGSIIGVASSGPMPAPAPAG